VMSKEALEQVLLWYFSFPIRIIPPLLHTHTAFIYHWHYIGWTLDSHSFCSLSYDRSIASSKASSPQGAILCFLFQFPVSSLSLRSSSSCLRLLPRLPVISIFLTFLQSRVLEGSTWQNCYIKTHFCLLSACLYLTVGFRLSFITHFAFYCRPLLLEICDHDNVHAEEKVIMNCAIHNRITYWDLMMKNHPILCCLI
jgi:hypothetical protein